MGRIVFDELTRPGATIGEAVMRAKHRLKSTVLVETYNLLGDPAIPVAVPEERTAPSGGGGRADRRCCNLLPQQQRPLRM